MPFLFLKHVNRSPGRQWEVFVMFALCIFVETFITYMYIKKDRSYTTCGRRNYKKPPALGSGIIKRLFFSELMQSSARAFRLERGMRLEFGFQPEGGSWKLWEVGGGSKEKAARGLRK